MRRLQAASATGHTIGLILLTLTATSAASDTENCVDEHVVKYAAENSEWLSRVQIERTAPAVVEKTLARRSGVVASPIGTGKLFVDQADMTKDAPWTSRVYVVTQSPVANGVIVTVSDHSNGGVRATWLNEKLVFLQVWWGRIRSTDLVLDVGLGRWIYAESADSLALILPLCAEPEARTPRGK